MRGRALLGEEMNSGPTVKELKTVIDEFVDSHGTYGTVELMAVANLYGNSGFFGKLCLLPRLSKILNRLKDGRWATGDRPWIDAAERLRIWTE